MTFSVCTNQFASASDEIELHCGLAMTRHPVQTHNIRISYLDKEILLFDEDASGAFRHAKLCPVVATSHAHAVGKTLCMSIGSVFDSNVIPCDWEVFA